MVTRPSKSQYRQVPRYHIEIDGYCHVDGRKVYQFSLFSFQKSNRTPTNEVPFLGVKENNSARSIIVTSA